MGSVWNQMSVCDRVKCFLEETLFFWTKIYFSILFYFSQIKVLKKSSHLHTVLFKYKKTGG